MIALQVGEVLSKSSPIFIFTQIELTCSIVIKFASIAITGDLLNNKEVYPVMG